MLVLYLSDRYVIGMVVWLLAGLAALYALLKLRRRCRSARSRSVSNLLLSMWLVTAMLTAIELGFALFYDTTDSFNMTNVSRRWFRVHSVAIEQEIRFSTGEHVWYRDDTTFPKDVAEGRHHVVFLGDSFTFGQGVSDLEDRFSNRIRRRFDHSHPGQFVVSNLGVPGTDLFWGCQVLDLLFVDEYDVDTVVYVMCLNDIEAFDVERRKYFNNVQRNDPSFFLFRDTYFFNLLYFRMQQFTLPEIQNYYSSLDDFYRGDPWTKMSNKLLIANTMCRKYDVRLHVVVFPFLHDRDGTYDFAEAHRTVMAFCAEQNIPALDLLPVLSPHFDEGLCVNIFDAHPNATAHALAADAIYEHLSDESPVSPGE